VHGAYMQRVYRCVCDTARAVKPVPVHGVPAISALSAELCQPPRIG
jgi:hypothetical protein